jgi:hypothetical protein
VADVALEEDARSNEVKGATNLHRRFDERESEREQKKCLMRKTRTAKMAGRPAW